MARKTIYADDLINTLEERRKQIKCDEYSDFLLKKTIDFVNSMPEADREHGEWVWNSGYGVWECTNCHGTIDKNTSLTTLGRTKHCQHCGAEMDGGKEWNKG